MSDLEIITRLTQCVKLKDRAIDAMYELLTQYVSIDELDKAGILDILRDSTFIISGVDVSEKTKTI